jgi:hypothetical protein
LITYYTVWLAWNKPLLFFGYPNRSKQVDGKPLVWTDHPDWTCVVVDKKEGRCAVFGTLHDKPIHKCFDKSEAEAATKLISGAYYETCHFEIAKKKKKL